MKNLKLLPVYFICLLFAACGFEWSVGPKPYERSSEYRSNSNTDLPPNDEPGKCYAQSMSPDPYSYKMGKIFEYTGIDTNSIGVKREIIVLSPATTKWEKGKADPNCKSQNPEDCMVMCLVDVPAVTTTYYIVTDTLINKQFKTKEIPLKILKKIERGIDWVEVLCEKDITFNKITALQHALNNRGYDVGTVNGIMNSDTKFQLYNFQKENSLPEGNLNIETLDVLGIY